ncbi:hypothetical protein LG299_05205 [Microbacterium lacus]|uniref:NaeI family type II restriction endonuclease n=1 Tax=Microbacterium lacus TaxID=415217 RepID=UPI00384EA0BB
MRPPAAEPGVLCTPDPRRGLEPLPHTLDDPTNDHELQVVWAWLASRPLATHLTNAVDDAVKYVLDGARTGRFDLNSPDVDSDERSSVGTKLQYRVLHELSLFKEPPLDTRVVDIPVELKGTIGRNWMIPTEGQCQISLLIQVDTDRGRHRALLMRTHRVWLNNGANKDGKRTIVAGALPIFALPLLDWTPLPAEPLRLLTPDQLRVVFAPRVGQASRLVSLFSFLPNTVIPRSSIETVCFGNKDPLRRARQAKASAHESGLEVLVGTWKADRARAEELGFDLSGAAWVAATTRTRNPAIDATNGRLLIDWGPAQTPPS